jgi:pimeloyl-ACP methyl ester carboxylesterase
MSCLFGNIRPSGREARNVGSLRHVVVVVPGIGGSVLTAPDGRSEWDLRPGDVARAVIDPENLAIDRDLVATGLVDDLTVLRPWLVVPGYGALTHHLRTQFGSGLRVRDFRVGTAVPSDVDVLRVPYDFRRSIVEAADVLGRAVSAAVGGSGRQVVVVAHSMGGLVARYWIGPGKGWRHCRALITLRSA